MGKGGKVANRTRGGRSWSTACARARRGSGSDDASDEEYVVGQDDEEEDAESSYSSDASREASQDGNCSEEGEEEDEDEEEWSWSDEEGVEAARRRRRRPQKELPGLRRGKCSAADEDGEMENSLLAKPRARRQRRPEVLAEAEEDGNEDGDDDDDEDFAPDEDEDEEEELARAPVRRPGGRRSGPVKRQGRRRRTRTPGNPKVEEKREKAPVRKRGRRAAPSSDDDDFVVEEVSSGRKRRSLALRSDPPDSDSSDLDYTISEEELEDLQVGGVLGQRERVDLPTALQGGEKGKGKEADDLGKRVCGICLSEEHSRVVRGLLDCCAHYFCFACIMEWSKVESRCPLCKRRFATVSKSARSDAGFGLRTAIIMIPQRDQVYQPSEEEMRGYLDPYANVICMECQQGGDDNLMLLCDICDSSAHTYCVGLGREVPEGNWYCHGCRFKDTGSSNSRVLESAVQHDILQEEFSGKADSENVAVHISDVIPQQSSSLPSQPPSQGISQGTSFRCQASAGDCETASSASGFAASTVSGRRSIHQRIRIILSNNRVRLIPGVARNDVIQPSSLESYHCGSEIQQNGDMHHVAQGSQTNGVNERNDISLGPRVGTHRCIHNEGSTSCLVEGAKKQVKSTVKKHLSRLTRGTSTGRRDLKEVARHATHTIFAACGFQHRQNKVTTVVQVPSNCVHLAHGELASPVTGCCSSCFTAFVENVVQEILDIKLRSA